MLSDTFSFLKYFQTLYFDHNFSLPKSSWILPISPPTQFSLCVSLKNKKKTTIIKTSQTNNKNKNKQIEPHITKQLIPNQLTSQPAKRQQQKKKKA